VKRLPLQGKEKIASLSMDLVLVLSIEEVRVFLGFIKVLGYVVNQVAQVVLVGQDVRVTQVEELTVKLP